MKTIEEIQAEEQQLAMDIADYAAHQPSSTAGGPVATDTTASADTSAQAAAAAEPAPPVTSTGGVSDLTPEQQTGAAPLTEDPAQAPVSADPSATNEAIPATSEPAAEPASATEGGGEPGAGATTDTTSAADPAPEAAATDTSETLPEIFAADYALLKSEVRELAAKIYGDAVSLEESGKCFIIKIGEDIKHVFKF